MGVTIAVQLAPATTNSGMPHAASARYAVGLAPISRRYARTACTSDYLSGISIIHFPPTQKILLTAAQCNRESSLQCKVLSRAVPFVRLARTPKDATAPLSTRVSDTLPPPNLSRRRNQPQSAARLPRR